MHSICPVPSARLVLHCPSQPARLVTFHPYCLDSLPVLCWEAALVSTFSFPGPSWSLSYRADLGFLCLGVRPPPQPVAGGPRLSSWLLSVPLHGKPDSRYLIFWTNPLCLIIFSHRFYLYAYSGEFPQFYFSILLLNF